MLISMLLMAVVSGMPFDLSAPTFAVAETHSQRVGVENRIVGDVRKLRGCLTLGLATFDLDRAGEDRVRRDVERHTTGAEAVRDERLLDVEEARLDGRGLRRDDRRERRVAEHRATDRDLRTSSHGRNRTVNRDDVVGRVDDGVEAAEGRITTRERRLVIVAAASVIEPPTLLRLMTVTTPSAEVALKFKVPATRALLIAVARAAASAVSSPEMS
jgi:hypothetical protein